VAGTVITARTAALSLRRLDLERTCALSGSVLLAFPAVLMLVTALLLAAGIPVSPLHIPLAAVLTVGTAAWLARALFGAVWLRRAPVAAGLAAVILGVSLLLESGVYDGSWDGTTYHALAIDQIAQGWNPLRDPTPSAQSYTKELTYFAKGPWLLAAAIERSTGSFEAAKGFGLYFVVAAFLCWLAALLSFRAINLTWAVATSAAIALNPVSGAQLFTHYVDGQLAALISTAMALLVLTSRHRYRALLPVLAVSVALIIVTKLTGALYIALIGGGFWIWCTLMGRRNSHVLAVWLLVGALAAVGTAGFNPYAIPLAAGTITQGNPFHPYDHYSSIINLESRTIFPDEGRLERIARSLLARSAIWPDPVIYYKLPFRVSREELRQFAAPDVRVGGFGPWFSGGVLLAAATLLLLLLERQRDRGVARLIVLAALTVASVLAMSETWWARLGPQLAIGPVLIAIAGLLTIRRSPHRYLPRIAIAVLCINSVMVAAAHASRSIAQSRAFEGQFAELRARPETVPVVHLDGFPGLRSRLERAGVDFRDVPLLPCPEAEHVAVNGLDVFTCEIQR
jgi:hypothetical protein